MSVDNVAILCYCVSSVCRLSSVCDVCIVAKRCVLEQKLLLTAYRINRFIIYDESIGTRPLFRGRLRSCQSLRLRHIRHWMSRKPLEIEAWFQRTTN